MMQPLSIPVDEFTTASPVTVEPGASLRTVAALMSEHGFRHLPVVEAEHPVGIISEREVRLVERLDGAEMLTAADVMVHSPFCVQSGTSLEDVALEMSRRKVGSAIVNDVDEIVGIFTSTDALNALVEVLRGNPA